MQECEWRLLGKNAERWGWFSEWDSEATWMKSLFDSSFRVFFLNFTYPTLFIESLEDALTVE